MFGINFTGTSDDVLDGFGDLLDDEDERREPDSHQWRRAQVRNAPLALELELDPDSVMQDLYYN